jgi:hypothetical protein
MAKSSSTLYKFIEKHIMPKNVLNGPWNYAITYLESFYNEEFLASGSGFFWEDINGNLMLLSNWHSFTGLDPRTSLSMHRMGAVPNYLKF